MSKLYYFILINCELSIKSCYSRCFNSVLYNINYNIISFSFYYSLYEKFIEMVRPIRLQEYSHLGGPDFVCFPHGDKICGGESTTSMWLPDIRYIYVRYTLSACAEQHNADLQVRPIQLALSVAGQRPPYGQWSSVDAASQADNALIPLSHSKRLSANYERDKRSFHVAAGTRV